MRPVLVHHLAASPRGDRIAAGASKNDVSVWDLREPTSVSMLRTVLDLGGSRLLLTGEPQRVLAAAYSDHGVAAYDLQGHVLWQRKDIEGVQRLQPSHYRPGIYVGVEPGTCMLLDLETGATLGSIQGAQTVWESPYQEICLLSREQLELASLSDYVPYREIARRTFAALAVCFSPDAVAISEACGPVRCIDTAHAKERWRWQPAAGEHALRLCFSMKLHAFFGVVWPYEEGGPQRLLRFDPGNGQAHEICEIGTAAETCFCLDNTCLITSAGTLIELGDGRVRAHYPFGTEWSAAD